MMHRLLVHTGTRRRSRISKMIRCGEFTTTTNFKSTQQEWERPASWDAQVLDLSAKYFNISNFRSCQKAAINLALARENLVLQLPTGMGKSLCFQLPALMKMPAADDLTIVICPILSLIQDQVDQLNRTHVDIGPRVKALSSQQTQEETEACFEALARGQISLLYTTPETFLRYFRSSSFGNMSDHLPVISRIVLDEAQCVTEWGQAFRPAYVDMCAMFKNDDRWSDVPLTLISASASRETVESICDAMGLSLDLNDERASRHAVLLRDISDRPNLSLYVVPKSDETIAEIAAKVKGQKLALVYCLTPRETIELTKSLQVFGLNVGAYHGQLSVNQRQRLHRLWSSGKIQILCATVAFAMGIHVPNLPLVIHYSMPVSLSMYYQTIGRAGRTTDEEAECVLYYSYRDYKRAQALLSYDDHRRDSSTSSISRTHCGEMSRSQKPLEELEKMLSFCLADVWKPSKPKSVCRREILYDALDVDFDSTSCRDKGKCNCRAYSNHELSAASYSSMQLPFPLKSSMVVLDKIDKSNQAIVEILFHRIEAQAKRQCRENNLRFHKRMNLSRKTIQKIIVLHRPSSVAALAQINGVGLDRAEWFFDILASEYIHES